MHGMLLAALHMSIAQTMAYIIDDKNQTIQYSPPERWMLDPCPDCYGGTKYALVLYSWTYHCTHPKLDYSTCNSHCVHCDSFWLSVTYTCR